MVSKPLMHVGLDAGGSSTTLRADISDASTASTLDLTGPPANAQRLGAKETARVLANLIQQAFTHYPDVHVAGIGAGISGAGRASEQKAIGRHLRDLLGHRAPDHICIEHDATIALEAAFGTESGIIVIAGTGSVAYARQPDETVARTGGWGHLVGDEGSGYVIGRAGVRAVAHAYDGGPSTRLVDLLADQCNVRTRGEIIHRIYRGEGLLQDAAPLVLEAARTGDDVAEQILADQTNVLAKQVKWLRGQCPSVEPRIALFGGLTHHATYEQALRNALSRHLPDCSVMRPETPPVDGALQLARQPVG